MKDLKHTPAPWLISPKYQVITDKDNYNIVQIAGITHEKEWEANAKLIASAPTMLDTLITVSNFYHNCEALTVAEQVILQKLMTKPLKNILESLLI